MGECLVGGPRQDEDAAVAGAEVAGDLVTTGRPGTEAEDAFFAEGDGDSDGAGHEVVGAVPVAANVVAQLAVIPVEEESVERGVNC